MAKFPSQISVSSSGGNSTLTITNFQNSDVGNYRCIASNSQGTNTSSNATVEIACKWGREEGREGKRSRKTISKR